MNITGEDLIFAGVVTAFITASCLAKRFSGPPMLLRRWAEEQGYVIVRAKYRAYAIGPFEKIGSREQQDVYEITFRTEDGMEREAWVRCNYVPGQEGVEAAWDTSQDAAAAESYNVRH
jgi:hypothetical protein